MEKRRVKRGWMNLEVTRIVEENHNTRTLFFEDATDRGCAFDYTAGQYLTFRFDSLTEKPVVRSYTMSSAPRTTSAIAVTVKEIEDGFVSKYLCRDVKVGDILRARGPIGAFCYAPAHDQQHLVMIGAGSGITPFISIATQECDQLGQPGHPTSMSLLLGFRSKNDLILWDAIQELAATPNITVHTFLSREKTSDNESFFHGRINGAALGTLCNNVLADRTYMTCGPEIMMNDISEYLSTNGVAKECIKTESFD